MASELLQRTYLRLLLANKTLCYFIYNQLVTMSIVEGDKNFVVGDFVRRISGTPIPGCPEAPEAVGWLGVIKHIAEASEWPIASGRMLPKLYFVHFPCFYTNPEHANVSIGVQEEDLVNAQEEDLAKAI